MITSSERENSHLEYEKSALYAKNKALIDSLSVSNKILFDGRSFLVKQQEKYEKIINGLKSDKNDLKDQLNESRSLYDALVVRYDKVLDSISKIKTVTIRDTVYVETKPIKKRSKS